MVLSREALTKISANLELLGERYDMTFMETASLDHRVDEMLSNPGWIVVTTQCKSHTKPTLVT